MRDYLRGTGFGSAGLVWLFEERKRLIEYHNPVRGTRSSEEVTRQFQLLVESAWAKTKIDGHTERVDDSDARSVEDADAPP